MGRMRQWITIGGWMAAVFLLTLVLLAFSSPGAKSANQDYVFDDVQDVSFAAPMPPRRVANHAARQCARIMPGDECGQAVLPPGWVYIDGECPEHYAEVEITIEWAHFKSDFCCSADHSGSSGDCEDVIIHRGEQRCAFVDAIDQCIALPSGWTAHGAECPSGWTWVEPLPCTIAESEQTNIQTSLPGSPTASLTTPQPIPTPTRSISTPQSDTSSSNSGGLCSVPIPLLIAAAFWIKASQETGNKRCKKKKGEKI